MTYGFCAAKKFSKTVSNSLCVWKHKSMGKRINRMMATATGSGMCGYQTVGYVRSFNSACMS